MRQKSMFKGVIALIFLLCAGFLPLFANPATAYANTLEPKLNVKSKAIVIGKDYTLKVYNLTDTQTVTFSSEDEKIASVDKDGVVKALTIGTTVVTAAVTDSSTEDTIKLQCKITAGPQALFVRLSRQEANMVVGQRSTMYWFLYPINAAELPKFSSSAPEIASVSVGGVVTAKSEGTAYIFAQLNNGYFDVCCVSVTAEGDITAEDAFESDIDMLEFLLELNKDFINDATTSQ